MKRRDFLSLSTAAFSYASFFTPSSLFGISNQENLLGFMPVPSSMEDRVNVPDGYEAKRLISWGDPLFSKASHFDQKRIISQESIQNAALTFGDNTDGMALFELDDQSAILAVNNEYVNVELMFKHRGEEMSLEDVGYQQQSIGVSLFEIKRDAKGEYRVVLDSKYNRRITAHTPIEICGPVKGHKSMQTLSDPDGAKVLGTIANCASGMTPWGTYLTCEENFNDFFGSKNKDFVPNSKQKRYGISAKKGDYQWCLDERFDIEKNPNECNRFGWVVEIDPFDPTSIPKKRTALGRFKHENAEVVLNSDGHIVVYMGDDENNEFIYKFVSSKKFDPKNPKSNRDLLDEGILYVAKFDSKEGQLYGNGEWIELSYGKNGLDSKNGFENQADVLIYARLAASVVGATPMDRPEWIAADPKQRYVYATLTNNKVRRNTDGANPREKNIYGQIIRWRPFNDDHTSKNFSWSIFLLAGNPLKHPNGPKRGTKNITVENMFNSPDGLKFDKFGRLWIETDGDYSNVGDYEGMGNNSLLCANPSNGEIKRFLTGPIGCEITGIAFSSDYKTLFVGIQHPGENLTPSHFPDGGDLIPRSTIMQITKKDGGVIGT